MARHPRVEAPRPNAPDPEVDYVVQHRKMLDLHLSGVPVAEALKRHPVPAVAQHPPLAVGSGLTRKGTHEVHVVLPRQLSQVEHAPAALGDESLDADSLARMCRDLEDE